MKQAGSVMEVARVLIPSLRNRLYLNAPEWAEPKNPWHEKTIIVPMLKSVGDKLWTTATVIILERESRDHKSLGSFYVKVVAYFPGRSDSGFSLNVPTEKNGQKLVLIRRETDIFETEVVQMNWRQIVLLLKAVERECQ